MRESPATDYRSGGPWPAVDPLGEALQFLRIASVFYTRSEFTAPWALTLPPLPGCLMFHVVTGGECRLVAGREERPLRQGSFALLPHGRGHRLLGGHGVPAPNLFDLPREEVSERYEILRHGGGGAPTTMICGAVRFDHPAAAHLVSLLPEVMTVDSWAPSHQEWIHSSLRLMGEEARLLQPGGEAVIARLADVLVIQTIRSWIAADPVARAGWLSALQNRQIGRAILLIHREPAKPWTVASLAREVAMSRSAFAARFKELVGESPMYYLGRWRMHVAVNWLREEGLTLAAIASRLGYQSEAAFSRAFKRFMGVPPGAVRRTRRAA